MIDEILTLLQTKFAGVTDNILSRIAGKIAKTAKTKEEAEAAVAEFTLQQLLEANGDFRANDASVTAVKNYEKKHGLKDGRKLNDSNAPESETEPEPKSKPEADEVPSWAQALMAELKAIKGEKITSTRKAAVEDLVKELPASMRKAYGRIDVASMSEDEFDALKSEIKAEVGDILKDDNGKRSVFGIPRIGSGDNAKADEATAAEIVSKMNF